jgi:hypothetical protein
MKILHVSGPLKCNKFPTRAGADPSAITKVSVINTYRLDGFLQIN